MVKLGFVVLLFMAGAVWAQDSASDSGMGEKKGPVLYGDGAGRLWKWEAGEKTFLTPEGRRLVLGGVGEKELWGWSVDRDQVRFFTAFLPKKKEQAADQASSKMKKKDQPLTPVFDRGSYLAPDRADRVGDRLLLVYGALSGQPRWEVWQAGKKIAAKAYDDGRLVYAAALGPQAQDGWIIAGRSGPGSPWLEVSGDPIEVPEGWRGRLTVAAWVEEKKQDSEEDTAPTPVPMPAPGQKKKPVPVHPWAAGWGAPGASNPRALFWGPDGWTQPDPGDENQSAAPGVYPLLGSSGGTLTLAGWQADKETGTLRPWFWDGTQAVVPEGSAEGSPQMFSTKGKGGAFLVVKHQSEPWFTLEDGKESQPLEGLGQDDRVVSLEPEVPKTGP
jgi:hypothetical protein